MGEGLEGKVTGEVFERWEVQVLEGVVPDVQGNWDDAGVKLVFGIQWVTRSAVEEVA